MARIDAPEPTLFEQVKVVIAETVGVSEALVTLDADLRDDLGCDSLDLVELAMALEETFGIELPDNDVEKVGTVADLIKLIKANGGPA